MRVILAILFAASAFGQAPLFREDFSRLQSGGVPQGWQFWSPRPTMKPAISGRPGAFRIAGNGNAQAKGRIWRTITGFQPGQWYRFEVRYTVNNVPNPENAVLAVVEMAGSQNHRALVIEKKTGNSVRAARTIQIPAKAGKELKLHLFAGFIPGGSVEWNEVTVRHVPGYNPEHRPVRLAVVDGRPPESGPAMASARFYSAEIDKACAGAPRTDLVLLPENFNKSNVTPQEPVAIDSPYMRVIRDAARRNRTYLAGSLYEDHEGVPFNAGFLIDRQGNLAGYYRKSHLTIGERVFSDIGRGDEAPVFKTDFGAVGLAVCFDFHFPEFARMLAVKGAELVLVPMASDDRHREDGVARSAEYAGKTFAIDNHIPVVFAATLASDRQPSLIIDQFAKVLARSNSKTHIIAADLDLAAEPMRWSGDSFHLIDVVGRRPEMYGELGTVR